MADETMRPVSLLFADIERSTRLLTDLGDAYADLLAGYYALLRKAVEAHGGAEVGTEGDGYFARFDTAYAAVAAAVDAQRGLAAADWPGGVEVLVRMGVHFGEALDGPVGPVGLDVHRAARIAAAAHGGQVLVSDHVRALVGHQLPDGVALRDLGAHRLRDLAEPQRLHQLLIEGLAIDFPPVRTLDAAPNNLPTMMTSFVGRERELERTRGLVEQNRLVTLTGPGGTGKTRLGLQTAACFVGVCTDGVWFVPLASIRDPALVTPAVMKALGVRESPTRELREQLVDHLRDRELLLVLDNFEQILDAASLVSEILAEAPAVRVLVTSRAPLHLSGEQEFPVPPLGVPDVDHLPPLDSLSQYAAVELFIERAKAARPDFAVTNDNAPAVAELTARLDGLPLAVELAAAKVRLLTPEAMLPRLERRLAALGAGPRDAPERQQTLRSAIGWSYDLLGEEERRLLACLGVFLDGWTLDQAEAVCDGDIDTLDGLAMLIDQSLVRQQEIGGEVRFTMLETIREFALERLDEAPGADGVRDRHAEVFLTLAEEASAHLLGFDQARWVATLEREHANLRVALDRLLERGDPATAARLGVALWRFWQKTHVQEGRRQVDRLLVAIGERADAALRADVLEAAGGLAYWAGDTEASRGHYEAALELERALDRPSGVANALYNLSFPVLFSQGREESEALVAESLERFEAVGDPAGTARARWGAGAVAYYHGRYKEAERLLAASAAESTAAGDAFQAHWARHMLALALLRQGRAAEAHPHAAEALRFFVDVGDHSAMPLLIDDFAELAAAAGDQERQVRLAAASLRMQQLSGVELVQRSRELEQRPGLDVASFQAAWDEGFAMSEEEAVAYALEDKMPR